MKVKLILTLLVIWAAGISLIKATPMQDDILIVVIGKSPIPYWANVELGVRAAAADLGLSDRQVTFYAPPREDIAEQLLVIETYTASNATGIAIAASDPKALEPALALAAESGVLITSLDTPPVEDSVSLVYIGTDNYSAGYTAGQVMTQLLPEGGQLAIGRGSDTALNALQRTEGFINALSTGFEVLPPVNDREDVETALHLANSIISANPDLAGAFGVYSSNGPAWVAALSENEKIGLVKLVSFDATPDTIDYIKVGIIDAIIAQREYDMGYQSVLMIYNMAMYGVDNALEMAGVVDGILDTGVDVITAANLSEYAASLDKRGIPYSWDLAGWSPPDDAYEFILETADENLE